MIYLKDFCKYDGTDDTVGFNTAVSTAISLQTTLLVNEGTIVISSRTISAQDAYVNSSINLDAPSDKRLKIIGEPGAEIRTNRELGTLFYFYYQFTDVEISGIKFTSTHSISATQTTALFIQGLSENSNRNMTISDCRFKGFSNAIVALGVDGLTIKKNVFESPLGHDNAQNNDEPAVYVWLQEGVNGVCKNVKVIDNEADGFTGVSVSSLTTKRAMDGFVYGTCYGLEYHGNTTQNFSHEHVSIAPTAQVTTNPNRIYGNTFYCKVPAGSIWMGNDLLKNYAVRCDANNTSIYNNDFVDCTESVLVYPFQYKDIKQGKFDIYGNRFWMADSTQEVAYAIKVQGSDKTVDNVYVNRAYDVTIENNKIYVHDEYQANLSLIRVWDTECPVVRNNIIFIKS